MGSASFGVGEEESRAPAPAPAPTCFPGVDDEHGRLEGVRLAQARPGHPHAAGVPDLGLADGHGDGAAGNVPAVLADVHQVLPDLLGHEGHAWRERSPGTEHSARSKPGHSPHART